MYILSPRAPVVGKHLIVTYKSNGMDIIRRHLLCHSENATLIFLGKILKSNQFVMITKWYPASLKCA